MASLSEADLAFPPNIINPVDLENKRRCAIIGKKYTIKIATIVNVISQINTQIALCSAVLFFCHKIFQINGKASCDVRHEYERNLYYHNASRN